MENTENTNIQELEQLRAEYNLLKEKLNRQDIINDRLMAATFKAKVGVFNRFKLVQLFCALFVIAAAPFSFHYGPLKLSWEFVVATDLMMILCVGLTWYWHHNVKAPEAGESLKDFTANVKLMKKRYQGWLKYSIPMVVAWMGWMFTEMFMKTDDVRFTAFFAGGLLFGAAIGGLIGLGMHKKVISNCDEILSQLEDL